MHENKLVLLLTSPIAWLSKAHMHQWKTGVKAIVWMCSFVDVFVRGCMVFCVCVHWDFHKATRFSQMFISTCCYVHIWTCLLHMFVCICLCMYFWNPKFKWIYSIDMKELTWSIVSQLWIRFLIKAIESKVRIVTCLPLRKTSSFIQIALSERKNFMSKEKWWVLAMVSLSCAHMWGC